MGGDNNQMAFLLDHNVQSEIESLCVHCQRNGITKLYLLEIKGFGPTLVSSFECGECGRSNRDVKSVQDISEHGVLFECMISTEEDLKRMVIRGEYSNLKIKELDLEIESGSSSVTTIESILQEIKDNLQGIKEQNGSGIDKLNSLVERIDQCLEGRSSLTIEMDDPSGNSYVEEVEHGKKDTRMKTQRYTRDMDQMARVGIRPTQTDEIDGSICIFDSNCPACRSKCDTRMKVIDIPHFKEIVLMSTTCDRCGFKSSEAKSSSGVSPMGVRIELRMENMDDLCRDVLKSETCSVEIPEIELELHFGSGVLGGRFTTVEGLIMSIYEDIKTKKPFLTGDSATEETKQRYLTLVSHLEEISTGSRGCTLILDDPMGNSFMSSLSKTDTRLEIIEYNRTHEQNDEFGLNDISVV